MKKNILQSIFFLLLTVLIIVSCELVTDTDTTTDPIATGDSLKISGQVVDSLSNKAIKDAVIILVIGENNFVGSTSNLGNYDFAVEINNEQSFTVAVYKQGYVNNSKSISTLTNLDVTLPIIKMLPLSAADGVEIVTLSGQVKDTVSNTPLQNVLIQIEDDTTKVGTITDVNGVYSAQVTVKGNETYRIKASREGYVSKSTSALLTVNDTLSVNNFSLKFINKALLVKATGIVNDSNSTAPLSDVLVTIENDTAKYGVVTGADGLYSFEIFVLEDQKYLLKAVRDGYTIHSDSVTITKTTTSLETIDIAQLVKVLQPSSINLVSVSNNTINVKESGAIEISEIIFELRDSSGVPMDLNNQYTMYYKLNNNPPGGGEFLFPDSSKTNEGGQAKTVLNSGTKAGVVQVIAELYYKNKLIRSKPVIIAIHGSLPDDNHLTITLSKYNIPALIRVEDVTATVIAGDKYSNPVRPGTAFYLNSTGGVMEGSIFTDNLGRGVATFITGHPTPTHPIHGFAYGEISAKTANENLDSISVETLFLYSGDISNFSVSPNSSFILPNGGSRNFSYIVSDANNHPLTQGSSYVVTVEGNNMGVTGAINITMGDVLFGGTNYQFTLFDKDPTVLDTTSVELKITASHPLTGSREIVIIGTAY